MNRKIFTIATMFTICANSFAQSVSFDSSYATNGINIDPYRNGKVDAIKILPDGSSLTAGIFSIFATGKLSSDGRIQKRNTDGSFNNNFGFNGTTSIDHITNQKYYFASDNNTVVFGNESDQLIAKKYNENGIINSSFGNNGLYSFEPFMGTKPQFIVGHVDNNTLFAFQNIEHRCKIASLNTNGTLNSSFGLNGIVDFGSIDYDFSSINSIVVLPNKDFLVFGNVWGRIQDEGPTYLLLIVKKYDLNGNIINSFGLNGMVIIDNLIDNLEGYDPATTKCALQSNGKIIFSIANMNNQIMPLTFDLIRLNANGTIDKAFGDNGICKIMKGSSFESDNYIRNEELILTQNGNILCSATIGYHSGLIKVFPNGTIDKKFGTNGFFEIYIRNSFTKNSTPCLLIDNNSSIYLAGSSSTVDRCDSLGCYDVLHPTIIKLKYDDAKMNLSIANNKIENYNIYPNPAHNTLKISSNAPINTIEIINNLGQVCINSTESEIDIYNLACGIYTIKIINSEGMVYYDKFIKE